jgi:hypothetical protein
MVATGAIAAQADTCWMITFWRTVTRARLALSSPFERLAEHHRLLGQAAGVVTDVAEERSQGLGRLHGLAAPERVEEGQHGMCGASEPCGVAELEVDALALVPITLERGLLGSSRRLTKRSMTPCAASRSSRHRELKPCPLPLRRVAQTKAPNRTIRPFADARLERILDAALDCTHA